MRSSKLCQQWSFHQIFCHINSFFYKIVPQTPPWVFFSLEKLVFIWNYRTEITPRTTKMTLFFEKEFLKSERPFDLLKRNAAKIISQFFMMWSWSFDQKLTKNYQFFWWYLICQQFNSNGKFFQTCRSFVLYWSKLI